MGASRASRAGFGAVAALLVAATVGGCAPPPGPSLHPPAPVDLGPSDAQRLALARADAAAILASAGVPRAALPPYLGAAAALIPAGAVPGVATLVDVHREFLVPAEARAAIPARGPAGATLESTSTGTDGETRTWALQPTPVLSLRWLLYTYRPVADGPGVLRADAYVAWVPRKSRAALVAPGAARLSWRAVAPVTTRGGPEVTHGTTTDAAAIDRVTDAVNALVPAGRGSRYCALDLGGSVALAFFARGTVAPYATVRIESSGCREVRVTQHPAEGSARTSEPLMGLGLAGRLSSLLAAPR